MRVLIFGGTGAMGMHLSRLLAFQNVNVSVTTRQTWTEAHGIRYVTGDAKNDDFLKEILNQQWDCIVDFMAYSTETFRKRLPILLNSTNQYVFLSSARVYANSDKPLTESSPRLLDSCNDLKYLDTDEYALAKARQENLLFESKNKNWTIIRPYITYATERLQLGVLEKEAWLYRSLHNRTVLFSKRLSNKVTTMTDGLDVAKAIAALVANERAFGEVYHITCNYAKTWHEILSIYDTALFNLSGLKLKIKYVELDTFITSHSGKYQILYDRLFDRVFDNSKINSIYPIESFVSPETGLLKYLKDFVQNPRFLTLDSKSEGIKDRLTGEFTNLTSFKTSRDKLRYLYYRFQYFNH